MLPDTGTVMVLVIRLTDCPTASVYGPVTTDADTNVTEAVTMFGTVIVLASKATAPSRASALPASVAPLSSVTDWAARIVPLKIELAPIVAELPT